VTASRGAAPTVESPTPLAEGPTLRGRITRAFGLFTLLGTVVFSTLTLLLLYSVEDHVFESQVQEEAAWLTNSRQRDGRWPAPRLPHMQLATSLAELPTDLIEQLRAEPQRHEFRGEAGRHYHVRAVSQSAAGVPDGWLVAEVSRQLAVRPLRRELIAKWMFVVVGILLGATWLARAVARRIATPLQQLATAVEGANASGGAALAVPLPPDADRELRVVARALEMWSQRVLRHVARERAFTRDVSHELRTPLSVLRSSVERGSAQPGVPHETQLALGVATRATQDLQRTIDTLLMLAREQEAPRRSDAAVRSALESVLLDRIEDLAARGLTLNIDVPRSLRLPVPEDVLQLMLASLFDNVRDHAAAGVVTVSSDAHGVAVHNRRQDSAGKGHGFGLPLVSRLAEATGLVVEVHSDDESFTVRLRLAQVPTPA
jgi:signal transduction histidine kinase